MVGDDLKNDDKLKIEENLTNEDNFIVKTVSGPSLHNLSCACYF